MPNNAQDTWRLLPEARHCEASPPRAVCPSAGPVARPPTVPAPADGRLLGRRAGPWGAGADGRGRGETGRGAGKAPGAAGSGWAPRGPLGSPKTAEAGGLSATIGTKG